jgi:hypothetical protein
MIETALINVCTAHGQPITGITHNGERAPGNRILLTIAGLESSFGERRLFVKYEPAYGPGGAYYQRSETVRKLWYTYGVLAASSFGSFQLMFVTARELGYTGTPIDLQKDEICAYWATELIRQRILKRQGAQTLAQLLDAYNSGNCKDRIIPADYIHKGELIYRDLGSI